MQFSEKTASHTKFLLVSWEDPHKTGNYTQVYHQGAHGKNHKQFLYLCLIIQLPCVNHLQLPFFDCMPNWGLFFGLAGLFLVSSVTESSAILTCIAHMNVVPYTAFFISPVWLQNLKLLTTVFHYVTTYNLSMI